MKSLTKLLLGVILLIGILSCENTSQGTFANLKFKALEQSGGVLKSTELEQYTFHSASIVIEKIELKKAETEEEVENEEETENEGEYNFYGPYLIDLLTGQSEPEIPIAEIEPGTYTKLDAEMAYFEEIGPSLYLRGTYTNDEGDPVEMEFEYTYMQSEDFKAENQNGFEITAEQINELLVQVDLGILLSGVDLSLAEADEEDGIIRLNKESNRDLADIIESNLEAASELGLDEDQNGEIDD